MCTPDARGNSRSAGDNRFREPLVRLCSVKHWQQQQQLGEEDKTDASTRIHRSLTWLGRTAMSEGFGNGHQEAAAAAAAAAAAGQLVDDNILVHGDGDTHEYQWAYGTIMDSSRVSTCLISMLLIVYGSFRSLNMEQEQREKEKKRQSESMNNLITGEPVQQEQNKFATLDTMHALCLPLGASVSLLVMFFFFDSQQRTLFDARPG